MNIKRVVEKDTRTAFELIKEQYGEDVVILSNKRVGKQVEIMVAIDLNDGSYNLQDDPESGVGKAKVIDKKKIHTPDEAKSAPTVAWMEARKKADAANPLKHREPLSEQESIEQVRKLLEKTKPVVEREDVVESPALVAENSELDDIKFEMSQLRDMFKTHLDMTARNEREALSVEAKKYYRKVGSSGCFS
jgi:flagellar biosynthesis GTPase FlhF